MLFHGYQTPRLRLTADQRTVSCDRQLTYDSRGNIISEKRNDVEATYAYKVYP